MSLPCRLIKQASSQLFTDGSKGKLYAANAGDDGAGLAAYLLHNHFGVTEEARVAADQHNHLLCAAPVRNPVYQDAVIFSRTIFSAPTRGKELEQAPAPHKDIGLFNVV